MMDKKDIKEIMKNTLKGYIDELEDKIDQEKDMERKEALIWKRYQMIDKYTELELGDIIDGKESDTWYTVSKSEEMNI